MPERPERSDERTLLQEPEQGAFPSNLDVLITTDMLGIIVDVNRQVCEVTGLTREELVGTRLKDYFTAAPRGEEDIGKVRAEGQIRIQAGALAAAANGILIADRDGRIEWVNRAFTTLTGYSPEEVIGQNPRILKSGMQDTEFYAGLWHTVLAGGVWHADLINRRKDGSLYPEEQTITPIRDVTGAITHFVAIKLDISERRQAELAQRRLRDQLAKSEKLAAMGELLASVAHELNNPLTVVVGNTTMLQAGGGDAPVMRRVQKIANARVDPPDATGTGWTAHRPIEAGRAGRRASTDLSSTTCRSAATSKGLLSLGA